MTDLAETTSHSPRTDQQPDVLVVVGRPTFDLASAEPLIAAAIESVDVATIVVGDGAVLMSPEEVSRALEPVAEQCHNLIVLFASFTDSRLAAAAVEHFATIESIVLWSLPEEWTGGRLLRNSLCGANLTAHRFVAEGRSVAALHEAPGPGAERSIERSIQDARSSRSERLPASRVDLTEDEESLVSTAVTAVRSARIGVIGDPPEGFKACDAPGPDAIDGLAVTNVELDALFAAASRPLSLTDEAVVSDIRDAPGNDHIDRAAIEHSVALQGGATRLAERNDFNALAIRCWPECFDQWDGAACAAMALLNEHGLPAACEADALGALSMRLMQTLSGEATFLADLVEVDVAADRLAFWHCGVAPRPMADETGAVSVALHPNRGMPLVFDFGIAEGPVTMVRVSNSAGSLAIVVGEGRLTGEQPFSGTSGVVQLSTSARSAIDTLFSEGLEHHFVLARGHQGHLVESVASRLDIPIIHLT